MTERKEAWFRIIVLIISGIVLGIWKALIQFLTIAHWIYVVLKEEDQENYQSSVRFGIHNFMFF